MLGVYRVWPSLQRRTHTLRLRNPTEDCDGASLHAVTICSAALQDFKATPVQGRQTAERKFVK